MRPARACRAVPCYCVLHWQEDILKAILLGSRCEEILSTACLDDRCEGVANSACIVLFPSFFFPFSIELFNYLFLKKEEKKGKVK